MRLSSFYKYGISFFVLLSLLGSSISFAQIQKPVKWDFKAENEKLILKATFGKGWHLYSQKSYGDEGPVPSSFEFTPSPNYEKDGATQEGSNLEKHMDKTWGFEIEFYELEATFSQKIKSKTDKPYTIKGKLQYMVCNDSMCLPPEEVEFEIKVDPQKKNDTIGGDNDGGSFSYIFFVGFLAGFGALLTPCVFPMIPLTVSFFTKRSSSRRKGVRNALIYSFSIIFIYVTIGLLFTIIFGVDALHAMSTNFWFNLFFFFMLVVFAASFLGAFEIVLPSSFVNKVDAKSDRGGLIGIFFMAFTLALVSFSCTSAFIGPLIFSAGATGQISGPFWGMLGFSTALALPFGLFAVFPTWLNSLPQSGGWLNSVKVVLGFLELALALKFASNADLVIQAGILTREVFIALWIIIFGLTGIYLLGWVKFAHDSDLKYVSVTRLFFAILALSFTTYLIPGLWGAPLKLVSAFVPPDFYSESPRGFGGSKGSTFNTSDSTGHSSNLKKNPCPNDLPCFHDYDEALAFARESKKPLMIDFTGWACVNCRKMEAQVWSDPEVDRRLRNDVVLVSLYVDDNNKLPLEEQGVKKLGNSDFKIKSIGSKWAYLQASRYETNTQPQYVLLDSSETLLLPPVGYNLDVLKYIKWLNDGVTEYKKKSEAKPAA